MKRLRALLCMLACCASTAATAGEPDTQAMTAEQEARALIGLVHGPTWMQGPIVDHLSCIDYGAGTLILRGREHVGWERSLAQCQGRFVMLLEQFLGGKTTAERRWRIVDAYLLPEVVGIQFEPDKPEGPYLYTPDECSLDGRWDSKFHAVVRLGKRKRMNWRTGVLGAWGYDMKRQRIVPLDTKRVVCHKPEPD